ncbi:MAG: NADH-quinone oxidoreductase subunit J [Burkholderiales bacterium]|jgi:NADH-quinone oxidoreductase subunit J|uniref:NADH-quinone oxidoreductase subunit J n=1 Tax=Candidatus Desulfobacillus denitrificans TaxID=2608985 RepID=A0A809RYS5_9PROT|nr:NADH-quinone oxidoreductase subunit J [Rhodocyclaceae bacterium]MCZ2175170.1 NADH-quinone oxidoreductase subunit J [Burkholderiales bacterium]OQY71314.1 MAG: NADH:ubiquinone oxidoreductase subunit J [Rhodocyclaceae bacterium UTPRO2]BBO21346.1 NADH:ubiquinone oxidoreductase subunit J [Candidatus Desulfobacillus denitrificans]GIK46630.1 MAG: NADH dehydrogenase subunit J [Betaproteobacteria bacterium]
MDFKTALFYILSTILVVAALRVVTSRNPVHAVLFLVLAFFNASGLWLLLQAEFLAIALIVVYVGAVMVLFLFVVMMLDINLERLRQGFWGNLWLGGPIAVLMVVEMVAVLSARSFGLEAMPAPAATAGSNTRALGAAIYTEYFYPFELASVILLVALIAAVALNLRQRRDNKQLHPSEQIAVRRQDRVRIVAMPSEKE